MNNSAVLMANAMSTRDPAALMVGVVLAIIAGLFYILSVSDDEDE